MPTIDNNVRILIKCGYAKFILPAGISADAISCLSRAVPVDEHQITYREHIYSEKANDDDVEITIISSDKIVKFLDRRGDKKRGDYDIVLSEVKNRLDERKQKLAVVFHDSYANVGGMHKFEYVDLADPKNDPEKIISAIVDTAMTGVKHDV